MADIDGKNGGTAPLAFVPQGYELNYFARKHRLTRDEALDLIERVGNDRAKLDAAADVFNRRKGDGLAADDPGSDAPRLADSAPDSPAPRSGRIGPGIALEK